jgi:hypothetical protein
LYFSLFDGFLFFTTITDGGMEKKVQSLTKQKWTLGGTVKQNRSGNFALLTQHFGTPKHKSRRLLAVDVLCGR